MNFTNKLKAFITNKKVIIGIIILALIGAFFVFRNGDEGPELFTLTSENLSSSGVTVGGTVVAQKEVNLSFEMSGRIASVSKNAGDKVSQGQVITRLDTGSISANILKAEADLDAEIAKLEEYKQREAIDSSENIQRKNQLIRELRNAYTISEDAVQNKTDQYFDNAQDRFPEIFSLLNDSTLRQKVNDERYKIGRLLEVWSEESINLTVDTYREDMIQEFKNNLSQVQAYLNLVSSAVNQFKSSNQYPQSTIDKYKTDTSTARTNLNSALSSILTAQEAFKSTVSQVPSQEARIKSARATLKNYQAELEKALIIAPFTGLITAQNAKVGMSASVGEKIVTMISDSNYGIDTYVPEVYIAQIKLGNKAKISLNSYGAGETFDATVTYIDPAASERDGVASYKVELVFDANDERIKSGMTADAEILTEAVNPAFWVPNTTIVDQGGVTYVKVKSGDTVELRRVEVGERNPSEVEILSGLIVGDQLIISVEK